MGGKTLPPLELDCSGCGHRWPTRAAAGSTIRCPECRHVRRVPAGRPGTAAAARAGNGADDSDAARLAALWAAELPAASPLDDLEGDSGHDCPECGEPMEWAGAHTILLCLTAHDDGLVRCYASPGAVERETQYALAHAAPGRPGGPSAAELERVAEERAVALDELAGIREQLGMIPRGDGWRADAVRALHQLGRLEERYKAARSAADLEAADAAAEELADDLAGVVAYADKLARRRDRRERVSTFLRFRRGDGDEYEFGDDDADDDDAGQAIEPGGHQDHSPVPGYVPPDPNWRASLPAGTVAYWDRITPAAGDPASDFWARWDAETQAAARADAVNGRHR